MSEHGTLSSTPVHVSIKPCRSAYFAGERLSVIIQVTNTRRSVTPVQKNASHSPVTGRTQHRRSSHSISSAPISRPPTSPGAQRPASPTSTPFLSILDPSIRRTGRIGIRHKRRSLSVNTTAVSELVGQDKSFQTYEGTQAFAKPSRLISIHPSHPHARKQSFDFSNSSPDSPFVATPLTHTASLESIAESAGGSEESETHLSPASLRRFSSIPNKVYKSSSSLRSSELHMSNSLSQHLPTSQASADNELLYYGYAQLQGLLICDDTIDVKTFKRKMRQTKGIGGGRMDIIDTNSFNGIPHNIDFTQRKGNNSNWAYDASQRVSFAGRDVDEASIIPLIDLQSSLLFVDLNLAAGEARSYQYEIDIPSCLPPTFKGRVFKLDYHLIIGISRAKSAFDLDLHSKYTTRVMKFPLRIYGNVKVEAPPIAYDIMWPLLESSRLVAAVVAELPLGSPEIAGSVEKSTEMEQVKDIDDLKRYARDLRRHNGSRVDEEELYPEHQPRYCRDAVEILTRVSKKVCYDVQKDGIGIATLTFVKPAYRLGESVLAVLDMNQQCYRGKILKFAAYLEAQETLPSSLINNQDSRSSGPSSHRIHAEYGASLLLYVSQVSFSLDIPSDATPAFSLRDSSARRSQGGLVWRVRFLFLVSLQSAVPETEEQQPYKQQRCLVRDGQHTEWSSNFTASDSRAPLQRIRRRITPAVDTLQQRSWLSYLFSKDSVAPSPPNDHDGDQVGGAVEKGVTGSDEETNDERRVPHQYQQWKGKGKEGLVEPDGLGDEVEWRRMGVERVECEIPIDVWPGNTAFRPNEVGFGV